jgi:hypothetical protein
MPERDGPGHGEGMTRNRKTPLFAVAAAATMLTATLAGMSALQLLLLAAALMAAPVLTYVISVVHRAHQHTGMQVRRVP